MENNLANEDKLSLVISKGICIDNYVGYFTINENNVENNLFFSSQNRLSQGEERVLVNDKIDFENKIVIVLESPHKDEFREIYKNENYYMCPAIGKTGDNLQNWFLERIENIDNFQLKTNEKYHVYLINAVQYQCSLGYSDTKLYRDENWCRLWFECGKRDDFISRLKNLNPNIIINACTLGGHNSNKRIFHKNMPNKKYLEVLQSLNYITKTLILPNEVNFDNNKKFTLKGYVQSAIDQAFNDNKVIKLHANHPSSWWSRRNRNIQKY